jgi:hypothetical protein
MRDLGLLLAHRYHLRNDRVFIVMLIHKLRRPGVEDLLPDYESPNN